MSVFEDLRQGFREGRGRSSPREAREAAFGYDDHGECKVVIAGLLEKTEWLNGQLGQWQAALAERDQYIVALHAERDGLAVELAWACATRDRYQRNGKLVLAQNRELESILKFPGAMKALKIALHPDTGKGGEVLSRTAIFQTLMRVVTRLGSK